MSRWMRAPAPPGTRHHWKRIAAGAATLLAVSAGIASADYDVSGKFLYRDRPFGPGGFTGSTADLPVRYADVEVQDANTQAVLGSGATDAAGAFTIRVVDASTRNLKIRVKTTAVNTPTLRVRVFVSTGNQSPYAVTSSTFGGHAPATNIDFTSTPVVALEGAGGDAFNIFDNAVDAFDFIASLRGSRPTRLMTLYWFLGPAATDGTYYLHADGSVHLLGITGANADSDGYDDTVILHEIGHYTEFNLAKSENPGGPHTLNGLYDLRLTWSEGFATFFANMVRDWRGLSRPDLYIDTSGDPGPGNAFISYQVETPGFTSGGPVGVLGANNEVSVNAALWDVVDTPGTNDGAPGVDDDGLSLVNGPLEFWQAFTTYFPSATTISAEDFWDGWFAGAHGHRPEMESIFGARGMEYFADAFEPDATPAQAHTVVASSPAEHHTIYPAGEEDWFVIGTVGGSQYGFATESLLSGLLTHLELYVNNGTTLIASSGNDTSAGSSLTYTPTNPTVLHVRCRRVNNVHTYGSYNFVVTGPPVAVEVSDVSIAALADGVYLTWRARQDGGFVRFDIERSGDAAGPWSAVGTANPPAQSGARWEFVDRSAAAGHSYAYQIAGIESDGTRSVFGPFTVTPPAPARLALSAPQPNPFNPTTLLRFEIPRSGRVWLRVFSAAGAHVRTLAAGENLAAGRHERIWDGRDDLGHAAASGVYLVRVDAGSQHDARRAVLVR